MARIYVTKGYKAPEGVDSRESVKEYQEKLGVKVDGIWGPKTEAAYQRSLERERRAENVYQQYYDMIMGSVNIPSFSVYVPPRAEIEKDVSGYLRPTVDSAIKRRREAADTNKAELDADAAARGMGRSTYVSSMKEREADDVEDDVGSLEAQYFSALSERVEDALRQYRQMKLDAEKAYASAYASASSAAMSLAGRFTTEHYDRETEAAAAESRSRMTFKNNWLRDAPLEEEEVLTYAHCEQYLGLLTGDQIRSLYYSDAPYWANRRAEMEEALTDKEFNTLRGENIAYGGGRRYEAPQ